MASSARNQSVSINGLLKVKWPSSLDESFVACQTWFSSKSSSPCLCIANDLWVGDSSGTISVFDRESGISRKKLARNGESIRCLLSSGDYIWCGCGSGTIMVLNQETYKPVKMIKIHSQAVVSLIEKNGQIWSGSGDSTIKLFDAKSFEEIGTLSGHSNWVRCLCHSGDFVFSGSEDNTIAVWDAKTLKKVDSLTGHTAGVLTMCVLNEALWSGSADGSIRIWDLQAKKNTATITPGNGHITCLVVFEQFVLGTSGDGVVTIWDSSTYATIMTIQEVDDSRKWAWSMAVQQNKVYTLYSDCLVLVWDVQEMLRLKPAHSRRSRGGLSDWSPSKADGADAEAQATATWTLDASQTFADLQSYRSKPKPTRIEILTALETLKRSEEKLNAWVSHKGEILRKLRSLKSDLDDIREWATDSSVQRAEATNPPSQQHLPAKS